MGSNDTRQRNRDVQSIATVTALEISERVDVTPIFALPRTPS